MQNAFRLLYYLFMDAGITFLHSGFTPHCSAIVDKHFEGYCSWQFMERGDLQLSYDDECEILNGAWFWACYPGPLIRFRAAPGQEFWRHRYVAFQGPRVQLWQAQGLLPTRAQAAPEDREFAPRFDELIDLAQRNDKWSAPRAVNILEGVLLELAEARAQVQTREPWLESVLQLLERDPHFVPDYDQLARTQGMALSTLRRKFREATGVALHAYVLECRVGQARSLLGEGDLPLKAIAEKLGYHDVAFFARQFREVVGVPPAAYRRSRQA